jgi:4'-phosphopantetheinyl transferase
MSAEPAGVRKEACGKATGTGVLHGALHRYVGTGAHPARLSDDLHLLDVPAPPGHAAAVALRVPAGTRPERVRRED